MPTDPQIRDTLPVQTLLRMALQSQRGHDHRCEAALQCLFTGQNVTTGLTRLFQPFDLTKPRFETLVALFALDPMPLAPADLAASIGTSRAAINETLDQLEQRAWIERQPDAHDRRVTFIALTSPGRQTITRAIRALFDVTAKLARDLASNEQATVAAACTKIRARAQERFSS